MLKYLPCAVYCRPMKKIYLLLISLLVFVAETKAQSEYQPYSYQFYQKLNSDIYSTKTRTHTTLKPFIIDSVSRKHYDLLLNAGNDSAQHSWVHRILFTQHLLDVKDPEYTFYADFLPDLIIGRDLVKHENTNINTRGYQLGGTIGSKFYFYSSGYENQAVLPAYLNTYAQQTGMITGQAYDRSFGKRKSDWSYITAIVSYTPIKFLNITLGQDKTFIGDGYRSLLMSDFSAPYSFLKLTANLGNVRYMAMYGLMNDPMATRLSYQDDYRKKWGTFHYLDWNVSNRLSLGFFDAVIWGDKDDSGNKRGFDFSYASPIIFLRPAEASNGSGDNALIGFTGKYKIADGVALYGQFALDEFESKSFFADGGSSRNKYGWQIGLRGAGLFKVKNFNYLVEFNGAKPYTYSEQQEIINYAQSSEPLAHPFGANFREVVGLLNYSYNKFDFSAEGDFGRYGLDINGLNYGKDPFLPYTMPAKTQGNYIGQGLTTNMYYLEGKVAYVLNPKYNLRIEAGGIHRNETNASFTDRTTMFTIGLRSSFRNLYTDIASYKTH